MAYSRPTLTRSLLAAAILVLVSLLGWLLVMFLRIQSEQPNLTIKAPNEIRWVHSLYGFGPTPDEQLLSPSSVAVAPDGRVYVTDPIRARVMVFNSSGGFVSLLHTGAGGYLEGQFIRPEAVAVDQQNGEVYIADSWAKKVIVFDATGLFVREMPVDVQARGVWVDDTRVYVLDQGKVIIYTHNGDRLLEFGVRGARPGELDAYLGITTDQAGRIYVADAFNQRLQCFDGDGSLIWANPEIPPRLSATFEETPTPEQESGFAWDLPQDLCFDGAGRLIVVDAFRFELVVVDPKTGEVVERYGEFGRYDGQFYYPTSVAYDAQHDWFVVADTANDRAQVVRIPGSEGSPFAPVLRVASSPWRYALLPALLMLAAAVLAVVSYVKMRRWSADAGVYSDTRADGLEHTQ